MLFHFQLSLSDIDRGVYENLDFRVVQHPSENLAYLLTRVFAYALSYEEGLEFSASGLSDPESPALKKLGSLGAIDQWIEIGNPSARKLHKASKAANRVVVYTYKNSEHLLQEISDNKVHRAEDLQIFSLEQKLLEKLSQSMKKNNRWSILHQQGQLDIDTGEVQMVMNVKRLAVIN